jgi:hypothetical protein
MRAPKAAKHQTTVGVRMPAELLQACEAAASHACMGTSTWIRGALARVLQADGVRDGVKPVSPTTRPRVEREAARPAA